MAINLREMRPDIRSANTLSIVDYARKNGLDITYEDYNVAFTSNPISNNQIKIDKDINTWFELDASGNEITHGNTVRFAMMHLDMLDKELTDDEWMEIINNLTGPDVSYLDRERYNDEYIMAQPKQVAHPSAPAENKMAENTGNAVKKKPANRGENIPMMGTVHNPGMRIAPEPQRQSLQAHQIPVPQGQLNYPGRKTFSKEQMAEILALVKRGIDVAPIDNLLLRPDQMRQIRLALQDGFDPKPFNFHFVPADYMKEVRLALKNGTDITLLEVTKDTSYIFSGDQAREIRKGLENGLSVETVKHYAVPYLNADAMKDMRLGLQDGFEQMKNLNTGNYSAKDIHNIRITLTINKILEAIMVHARALFDKILDLFRKIIESNLYQNQTDMEEEIVSSPEKVAHHEIKETVRQVYNSMQDQLEELPMEEREGSLTKIIERIVSESASMEQAIDAEPAAIVTEVVQKILDEQAEFALQQKALDNAIDNYITEFYDAEDLLNIKHVEFSSRVMADQSLTKEQKEEIMNATIGSTYSKDAAQMISERISEQSQIFQENNRAKVIFEEYEIAQVRVEEMELEI